MRNIIILSFIISLWACQSLKIIMVDIDVDRSQKRTISEFVDSVRFIKLETTDDNLIGYVSGIYFDTSKLIVTDVSEEQILVFNEDGTFVNKIKKTGLGPDEYLSMDKGFYDSGSKNIIVYDLYNRKLLHYTLDGKLVKEVRNFSDSAIIRDMLNLPNGNFLCYTYDLPSKHVGNNASGLWEVDAEGNFIRSIFTIDELYLVVHNRANSYLRLLSDNRVLFRDAQFNDIYYWENDTLVKFISYKIKDDIIPLFKGSTFVQEKFIKSFTSQDVRNYIFTYWGDFADCFYTVFNKKTNENILVHPAKSFWQSIDVVEPERRNFIDNNKSDLLVTSLSGSAILEYIKSIDSNPIIKIKLQEIIKDMSEREIMEMNPVLQLLYVKK